MDWRIALARASSTACTGLKMGKGKDYTSIPRAEQNLLLHQHEGSWGAGREGEVAICLRDDPVCQGGLCCSLPPPRVPPPPSWDKGIGFPLTHVAEEAGYACERRQLLAGTFVSDFPGCGAFRTLAG